MIAPPEFIWNLLRCNEMFTSIDSNTFLQSLSIPNRELDDFRG